MQTAPITTGSKDNQHTDKTFSDEAEQENRIPLGMSEALAPNTGNHCVSQDHILQADSSSNILKQKNNGELMVSDANQNFNCPFTEAAHDKSLQKTVLSTKQIETSEGTSTCINKEPHVESSQSKSGEENLKDSSVADVSGSNEVQREMDVQEDENLESISSSVDSVDPTSISSLKSPSGAIPIQDRGHIPISKPKNRILKFTKVRKDRVKSTKASMEKVAVDCYTCEWKLADNGVVENFRSLYVSHCSWLSNLKSLEFPIRNYKDYISVVKAESIVAVAFNKERYSCLDGIPISNLLEEVYPSLGNTEMSDLQFNLAHSPLYNQQNGVWKKCFAVDGIKEERNWQGILYMRQIWAKLKSPLEDRYRMVKFFLSNSQDKSADGVAKCISKDLHIPHCFDIVEMVFFTLQDLEKKKEVIRVIGDTPSVPVTQSSEVVTMEPAPPVNPSSANHEGSTKILTELSFDTTSSADHVAPTVNSRPEQLLQYENRSPLLPVEKNDIDSNQNSEAAAQETQSTMEISDNVAENEKNIVGNSMDCEYSDECIPNQSVSKSLEDSTVKQLSETTLSLLRGEQTTFGIAKTSQKSDENLHCKDSVLGKAAKVAVSRVKTPRKSVENLHRGDSVLGETAKVAVSRVKTPKKSVENLHRGGSVLGETAKRAATMDVNTYINTILKETGNGVAKEGLVHQEIPSSSGMKKPLEMIRINTWIVEKSTPTQNSHSAPIKEEAVKIESNMVPIIPDTPSCSNEKRIITKKIKFDCSPPKRRKIIKIEGTADDYFMPLAVGWVREVVRRGVAHSIRADVYYHPPVGKKLRSTVEVEKYLNDQNITELSMKNFTFRKDPLGFGPPYELLRGAHITGNYFKKKGTTGSSPETPGEDSKPPKKLKTSPASDNSTPTTKPKKNPKVKKSAKLKWTFGESLDMTESQAGLLNESWGDEVDITNEVGETTGYEGWIASQKIKQSSTPTKAKLTEPKKILINKRQSEGVKSDNILGIVPHNFRVDQQKPFTSLLYVTKNPCIIDPLKVVGKEINCARGKKGKGSLQVRFTPLKSSGLNSETGNSQITDITEITSDIRDTVNQDGTQVKKNMWLDIVEKYEKRKIIRKRNKDRNIFDFIPVELQRFSELNNHTASNAEPEFRLFLEEKQPTYIGKKSVCATTSSEKSVCATTSSEKSVCATTSGEKSVSRIRVKSFSELAEVGNISKNLNNTSGTFVTITAPSSVCSSSVPGGNLLAPGSGSENTVSINNLGQANPQLQRPMVVYAIGSQNNHQVPSRTRTIIVRKNDAFNSAWHAPVGPAVSKAVTHQRLPANRVSFTSSATPGTWSSSNQLVIMPYTPVMMHPAQQGAVPKTQTISKLPENYSSLGQINTVNIQQSASHSQATFSQLPTSSTSFLNQGNAINMQRPNNFGYTGFGFYKEHSTTDDGVS